MAFVDQVAELEEEASSLITSTQATIVESLVHTTSNLAAACDPAELHRSILAQLSSSLAPPHDSVPIELLTPPASREPSPDRLRAKSPVRWRLVRAMSDAVRSLEPDVYGMSRCYILLHTEILNLTTVLVPAPDDPSTGRHVRHLDFNHFRTIGMRRSVEEGVRSRFVTAERLVRVLKVSRSWS